MEMVELIGQKERIFLLLNEDLRLEYVSRTLSSESDERIGEEFQVGRFLPDFLPAEERADFVAQLRKGFDGVSFSFEAFFPFDYQCPGESLVTVTPAQFENGKVKAVSVSVECHDSFWDDLARLGSHGLAGQVYNSISVGICVLDENGRYIDVNRSFCKIIEAKREKLIGRQIGFSLKMDFRAKVEILRRELVTQDEVTAEEVELTLPSGKSVVLSIKSNLLSPSSGEKCLILAVQDITKVKRLQFQLGAITSQLPGIAIRHVLYPDGTDRILYVSPGAEHLYGYDIPTLLGDASLIWNSVAPEYLEQLHEIIQKSGKELSDWSYTYRYAHPNGTSRWLKGAGTPTACPDGSIVWESFILDVTEETEARLEFAKKERLFNSLINDGAEMMALLDAEGRYVFTSPSFLHKLGYDAGDLKGVDAFSQIHPDYVDQVRQDFVGLLTQDKAITKPYLKRKKDGSHIWLQTTGTNQLKDPLINGIVINSIDITDLVLAEQEVKASEMQYKHLFENNPSAMMIWGLEDGMVLDVNAPCESLYGYTRKEFLAKSIYDIRPDADVQWMKNLMTERISHLRVGDKYYTGISRHVKGCGEIMDVEIDSRVIDYKGKLASIVLTSDVTEKLRVQKAVQDSEAKYRILFENNPLPGYIYRKNDLKILDVNGQALRHYGYSREEFLQMTALELRPESEIEFFLNTFREEVNPRDGHFSGVCLHRKKNGQTISVEVTVQAIQFQGDDCSIVAMRDVSDEIVQEKLDDLEHQVMEQTIQEGDSLENRLEKYLNGIEGVFPGVKTSVFNIKEGQIAGLISPSLSPGFLCGLGAVNLILREILGPEPVFWGVKEIEQEKSTDPKWQFLKEAFERENLKNCYFQPVFDSYQQLVGAFGIYFSGTETPEKSMTDHFFRIGNRIGLILENHLKSQELQLSNERYNYVNLATRDALYDYDLVQDKLFWGQSYQRLTGYLPQGVNPSLSDWRTLIHPKDRSRVTEQLDKTIADPSQPLFQVDYQIRRADQSYAHVTDRGFIIRDKQGKAIRIVGVLADISERKEFEASLKLLNETLENRNKELALSNAELEQFAYVASHDLQEPLRMISAFMSQLELKYKDQLDEKARRYIYFAVDGAKRMRQIILDLLEFSRVGRLEEEETDVSLNEIIDQVKALHRNGLNTGQIRISCSDLPVIRAGRTPLQQIFQNLVANGVKYSREGVQPCVDISVQDRGGFWEFEVKDNGIGIDESDHEKIFVIFKRLNSQEKYHGTGIGLSIVKKILDQMGGKIWLKSKVGEGSSFYFTLPK